MAITEFVLPTFKQDIESITAFAKIIAPFLSNLVDNHTTPPKLKHYGKVVSEDGKDVTGDFRPCLGIGLSCLSYLSSTPLPFRRLDFDLAK